MWNSNKIEIGDEYIYFNRPNTKWRVVGKDWSGNDRQIWMAQDNDNTRIPYILGEFITLVKEGKFRSTNIPTEIKTNLKRSHLLNFMMSMYELGYTDKSSTKKRTHNELEELFNEFIKK